MDPNKRPTFSELVSLMSQNLASLAGYLDVCTFTESETHARKDPDGDTEVKEDKMWQSQNYCLLFIMSILYCND